MKDAPYKDQRLLPREVPIASQNPMDYFRFPPSAEDREKDLDYVDVMDLQDEIDQLDLED